MCKKLFAIIICAVVIAAALCSCEKMPEEGNIVNVDYTPEPTPVTLELAERRTELVCGDTFTVAECISDDLLLAGNASGVYRDLDKLRGAYRLAASDAVLAGLMKDGTLRIIGDNANQYSTALSWNSLVEIAFGDGFLVGLRSDGTVTACGDNTMGQCDTDDIRRAVKIAAGDYHMAAITDSGKVVTRGAYDGIDNTDTWTDVVQIECGSNFTIGIKKDGTVLEYQAEFAQGWSDVSAVHARGDIAAALTNSGNIITNAEYDVSQLTDVEAFDIGDGFLAVRCSDDEVKCVGANDNLQCETQWWSTGLTVHETGYITGFAEETDIGMAVEVLKSTFETNVELTTQTGGKYSSDVIGTGAIVKAENGTKLGEVLIYGDTTGDGKISDNDIKAIENHIKGDKKLRDVYLAAAHVTHYDSDTKPLSNEDITLISLQIDGSSYIKQYTHDEFSSSMQKYYEINSDVVGYIRVADTKLDYPILYGGKNYYYHTRTIYHAYSGVGSIYSVHGEYHKNNVVIGHNARGSGRMFNNLHKLQDRGTDLLVYKNRVINVTIYHEYSTWEMFALYETGPYEPLSTQVNNIQGLDGLTNEQIQAWINGQISRSEVKMNVTAKAEDTLLTLYTCGDEYYSDPDTQSRLYLFFRRVG